MAFKKKIGEEYLVALCKHYVANYGHAVHALEDWRFHFVEGSTVPELQAVCKKYSDEDEGGYVAESFKELAAKGLLIEQEWGFCLSTEGFEEGTRGRMGRILKYLNKNPGLAIVISGVISGLALLVSVIALYFSVRKP